MPLVVMTAPISEPLTLAEVKLYLRQEADFEDATITRMMKAARRWIEQKTWRALYAQTLELQMERFPGGRRIILPRPKLVSITSITYLSSGSWVTLDSGRYALDSGSEPGRVEVDTSGWPTADEALIAVKVRYVAGWTEAEFPDELRQALLMLVSAFYTHREGLPEEVRMAVELLIGDYCVRALTEIPYLRGTDGDLTELAHREAYDG